MPTRLDRIRDLMQAKFAPAHMELHDESHNHSLGAETHFNLIVVAEAFNEQGRLQRQRAIHAALGSLMEEIHSLTMKALTPQEWAAMEDVANPSPPCRGGSKG